MNKLEIGVNAKPASGKKIHHSVFRPIGRRHTLLCNSAFNLGIDGWIRNWLKTDKPVTCDHCLRLKRYYDGISRISSTR